MTLLMSDGRIFTRYGGRCGTGNPNLPGESSEAARLRMTANAEAMLAEMRAEAERRARFATWHPPR